MRHDNTKKAEATRTRILETALEVFREQGFRSATVRDIASAAQVAVGAAYYYFPSKDAIVIAFYEQAQADMSATMAKALRENKSFRARLNAIIRCKLTYFENDRELLGALSAHTDPEHPLSPFSRETKRIRDTDIDFFQAAVEDSKVKLPRNIGRYLPRLLWLYQMGIILFWVYDHSPRQWRTAVVLEKTLKMIDLGIRMAGLPLFRPVHKLSAELLAAVFTDETAANELLPREQE